MTFCANKQKVGLNLWFWCILVQISVFRNTGVGVIGISRSEYLNILIILLSFLVCQLSNCHLRNMWEHLGLHESLIQWCDHFGTDQN